MPAQVIPFHPYRSRQAAAYALALSARFERVSVAKPWVHPRNPERLGNLLQRLALTRPALVFIIERLVADIADQLERTG